MNWIIVLITLYLIAIIFMAFKGFKKTTKEDFLINSRETKLIPLIFTSLATFAGGGVTIGLITMGYQGGFAAVVIGLSYVLGFFLFSLFAKKIHDLGRQENIYSFIGYLNYKFQSKEKSFNKTFSLTVGLVNLFILFFLLAVQFVGITTMLQHYLSLDYLYALIISCLVIVLYTTIVGLKGVIMTDMAQFILMIVIIVVVLIPGIFIDTENLNLLNTLPKSYLNGTGFGLIFLIGLPLFFMPTLFVQMALWQRVLSAKNGITAKRATIWSGIGMLPFYLVFPLVGMSVLITNGDIGNANFAIFIFLSNHCNNFLLGVAIVGFLAALMSTADSYLNIISISVIKDLVNKKSKPVDSKIELKLIKIATLVFGLLALLLSILIPDIVDLFVLGSSAIVVFVPATVHSLIRADVKKYRHSALFSFILGFVTNIVFFSIGIISPDKFDSKSSFVPAFIVSLLSYIIFNSLSKKTNHENRN